MRSNPIGSTGVTVSELGLGTAQLGDLFVPLDDDDADAIVDQAWMTGIRYFDTAPLYGVGLAETRLGRALRGRPRGEYSVSTKVGRLLDTADGPTWHWDLTPDGIRRSVDESLARLGLDRLDIAYIHDPQLGGLAEAIDSAYPVLAQLRSEGVLGAIGVGSGDVDALTAFVRRTDLDVVMVAGRYTLLEQPARSHLLPECRRRGVSVVNVGVFNSGVLAEEAPSDASHYEYGDVPTELLDRARHLAAIASSFGTSLPQAALKYATRHAAIVSVVVGAESAQQLRRNSELFSQAVDLEPLWARLREEGLTSY